MENNYIDSSQNFKERNLDYGEVEPSADGDGVSAPGTIKNHRWTNVLVVLVSLVLIIISVVIALGSIDNHRGSSLPSLRPIPQTLPDSVR